MLSPWSRSRLRVGNRWLAWPLSLALLLALVLTGVHHHVNASASHGCTVCSLSQAPAATPAALPAGQTTSPRGSTIVDGLNQPDHGITVVPTSRGPPLV